MVLVAGTGRNTGKTSLVCELIRHFSSANELVGIKISSHIHQKSHGNKLLYYSDHFIIYEETNAESEKDSSKMLKAGAHKVYYIESAERYISEALKIILSDIRFKPVICESGALRNFVSPGIFIFLEDRLISGNNKNKEQKEKADFIVYASENSVNFNPGDIYFNGKRWTQ
jgi:hypothetical protein